MEYPSTENYLNSHGFFILTDPPESLDFGIDTMSYETGPNFRGISLIPSGIHFIYHSLGMGMRQGYFKFFAKGDIEIKSWDSSNEEISIANVLSDETCRLIKLSLSRGDFNNQLGSYPYAQHSSWQNLSNFITLRVLNKAECPPGTVLYPGDADDDDISDYSSIGKTPHPQNMSLKPYFPNSARVCRFTDIKAVEEMLIDKIISNSLLVGIDRAMTLTQIHVDTSQILENLVLNCCENSWEDLLGELQLSFIVFILLYSYPALEQWKKLINLICSSHEWIVKDSQFTISFTRILYEHLKFTPEDFFGNELSKDNFLVQSISSLLTALNSSLDENVLENKRRLYTFMQSQYGLFNEINLAWINFADESNCDREIISVLKKYPLVSEDMYNLVEEDMPVIVGYSEDEVRCHLEGVEVTVEMSNGVGGVVCNAVVSTVSEEARHRSHWENVDASISSSRGLSTSTPLNSSFPIENSISIQASAVEQQSQSSVEMEIEMEVVQQPSGSRSRGADHNVMYSWRYPLLYEAMMSSDGCEDLVMTAARVVDEYCNVVTEDPDDRCLALDDSVFAHITSSAQRKEMRGALLSLFQEAKMFIEHEVVLRNI